MKFIMENSCQDIKFKDLEYSQFFKDGEGNLCQKVTNVSWNIITDSKGFPCSYQTSRDRAGCIPKVLKVYYVEKIEF